MPFLFNALHMQDVPDTKGDIHAGVSTLTVRFGAKRIFWACVWILTLAYIGAIVYSLSAGACIGSSSGKHDLRLIKV